MLIAIVGSLAMIGLTCAYRLFGAGLAAKQQQWNSTADGRAKTPHSR